MNTYQLKWKTINDVPQLIVEWARIVTDDQQINVDDIIELVSSYEDWLDNQVDEKASQ